MYQGLKSASIVLYGAYYLRGFAACNGRIMEMQKADSHSFRNLWEYKYTFKD